MLADPALANRIDKTREPVPDNCKSIGAELSAARSELIQTAYGR
jgi:hypothetical protein